MHNYRLPFLFVVIAYVLVRRKYRDEYIDELERIYNEAYETEGRIGALWRIAKDHLETAARKLVEHSVISVLLEGVRRVLF